MIKFEGNEHTPAGCVILAVVLNVLVMAAVGYAALHFILKYW